MESIGTLGSLLDDIDLDDIPLDFSVLSAIATEHSFIPDTFADTFDPEVTMDVLGVLDQMRFDDEDSSYESDESSSPFGTLTSSTMVVSSSITSSGGDDSPILVPESSTDMISEVDLAKSVSAVESGSEDSKIRRDDEDSKDSGLYDEVDAPEVLPVMVKPLMAKMATAEFDAARSVLRRIGTSRRDIGDLKSAEFTQEQLEIKRKTGIKAHLLVSRGLDLSKILQKRRDTEVRFKEARDKGKALTTKEGYITKRAGGKHVGMWKKRYLLLKRGYLLWSYKPIEIENPAVAVERRKFLNNVSLLKVHKAIRVDSKNGRKFNVITTKRVIRLRASSKKERDLWVDGINAHLEVIADSVRWLHGISHLAPGVLKDIADSSKKSEKAVIESAED
jgi:hypothetical protein